MQIPNRVTTELPYAFCRSPADLCKRGGRVPLFVYAGCNVWSRMGGDDLNGQHAGAWRGHAHPLRFDGDEHVLFLRLGKLANCALSLCCRNQN